MGTHSAITGKRGEYMVIGKLLEKGFTVYTPVADIEGIDCIIRNEKNRLIEIQIKTRNENDEGDKQFRVKNLKPNKDFFIACYLIDKDALWIIPSFTFKKYSFSINDEVFALPMNISNKRELSKYKDELGLELLKYGSMSD